jgi:hypothetical protein
MEDALKPDHEMVAESVHTFDTEEAAALWYREQSPLFEGRGKVLIFR